MKVAQILKSKGTRVVTVRPHTDVTALVHRLRLEGIGAAVVSSDETTIEGIVSERDIVLGLAQHGARLLTMTVAELMTRRVLTCTPEDSVKDVMRQMTVKRLRHLPVLENGRLAGIVSIGDVVKNRLEEMELETNVLRDYAIAHQ